MPPFDFKSYLLEKDNRDFNLLIDQPEKCNLGVAEGPQGGREGAAAAAPYMLIAVKSVAADFDKRQVTFSCALLKFQLHMSYSVENIMVTISITFSE